VTFTKFILPKNDCVNISNFVYQEKDNWKKDLNNVKSLTSGFNPDYKFLHDIGDFCCSKILSNFENNTSWKKSCWWINFYNKGNYANPHRHLPEEYSMIIIIKPSENNCLHFKVDEKDTLIKEQEGLSLIFKSNLQHWVDPVNSDRITIAMDFVKNQ
jgi:hypothetical protein